ncbi:hypothetical protein X777_05826, partial [Ooceraea biroi]
VSQIMCITSHGFSSVSVGSRYVKIYNVAPGAITSAPQHPDPERRSAAFPPECWISFRYLESWQAYWQGATVGTRPQRHVIVILFLLLSCTRDSLPFCTPVTPLARSSCLTLFASFSSSLGSRKLLPLLSTLFSP